MKIKIFWAHPYKKEIGWFVEKDYRKAEKVFSDYGCEIEIGSKYKGICVERKNGSQLIWFTHISDKACIMHESIHAAFHILDRCGVALTGDNHEALVYLSEYIFTKICTG